MLIVDSQVHMKWQPEAAILAMDGLGITAMVTEEFWHYDDTYGEDRPHPGVLVEGGAWRPLSPLSELAALRYPDRFAGCIRVDYRDPALDAIVNIVSTAPHTVALRYSPHTAAEVDAMLDGQHRALFKASETHSVPLFFHAYHAAPQLTSVVTPYLKEFPGATLIIDHCGEPASEERWEAILKLGELPNVALKWCHPQLFFYEWFDPGRAKEYPYSDLMPFLRQALDAYGQERVMWASDVTVNYFPWPWAERLMSVKDSDSLTQEEKEWVLGKSACKILGLEVTDASPA